MRILLVPAIPVETSDQGGFPLEAGPMSQILELPDWIDAALRKAAEASGTTPVEWIAARLAESSNPSTPPLQAKSLADLFAGRLGCIEGDEARRNEADFAEYLESKRREGCL